RPSCIASPGRIARHKSPGNQQKPLPLANQVVASHRGEISRAEFERGLGSKIDLVVPFDIKAAMATARGGKALPAAAGSSKPAAELRRLAAQLSGAQPKGRGTKRRWFGCGLNRDVWPSRR